jgi:hypothetical protein
MHDTYKKNRFYIVTILIIFTLGCGYFNRTSDDEISRKKINPLATAVANVTATPTPTLPENLPTGLTMSTGLETLSTYRAIMMVKHGDKTIDITVEDVTSPATQHVILESAGAPVGGIDKSSMTEVYHVDDTIYVRYAPGEPWLFLMASEAHRVYIPGFALIENNINPLPKTAQRSTEQETINGRLTYRYDFTDHSFSESEGVTTQGSVWVAIEGGYVIKVEATGQNDSTFNLTYELSGIGGDITISVPEDTQNATHLGE